MRAILSGESDADDILSAIYAAYDGLVLLSTPIAESLTAVYGDQSLEVEDELSGASGYLRAHGQGSTSVRFSTNWVLPRAQKRLPWESGGG